MIGSNVVKATSEWSGGTARIWWIGRTSLSGLRLAGVVGADGSPCLVCASCRCMSVVRRLTRGAIADDDVVGKGRY
jgi:hypothetical protein